MWVFRILSSSACKCQLPPTVSSRAPGYWLMSSNQLQQPCYVPCSLLLTTSHVRTTSLPCSTAFASEDNDVRACALAVAEQLAADDSALRELQQVCRALSA